MLDKGAWDALTGNAGFFLSHGYLTALESVLPDNLTPRYALMFDGGQRPVAAVAMQIADIGIAQIRPKKPAAAVPRKMLLPLGKIAERATQRILTCGNLLSYGQHGIAIAPDVDPSLVWHGVAEVLYRVRNADKLRGKTHFVLIKDIHGDCTESATCLESLSYRYVATEPNMVLKIGNEWKSHDDDLASLSSKYRSNVRNSVFKPIEQADCTVEPMADVEANMARIHELYQSVQGNASFRPYVLPAAYFPALQRIAGERLRCSVLKLNEVILGFLFTLADGDTAVAYHIGFDREAATTLPIYLRLLHAGISDAIALGCKDISFGRTALEPKAALGAKPVEFGVLVRHRQPVLNKLIKRLLLGIEHAQPPPRNPFKK
ncbi:MAG: GNAT family N-acetyltransferase [Verrucomicrobia bacterium]|nr:GNAT family N-acetyltransferase [Verrucomicrobiota bacterium]